MADPISLAITPDTRLSTLLETLPELEPVLLRLSPAFARLRNPILRRTVARVATLRQVALVGGLQLGVLITELRRAAGLAVEPMADDPVLPVERPAWARSEAVTMRFDAVQLIESGGNPLGEIMALLARLGPGQSLELVTSFVPAPLVELSANKGLLSTSWQTHADRVTTVFHRPAAAAEPPAAFDPRAAATDATRARAPHPEPFQEIPSHDRQGI